MHIKDLKTLREIFSVIDVQKIFGTELEYLLINTDNKSWDRDLSSALHPIQNSNQALAICLIVKNQEDISRIDMIFLICKKSEIDANFKKQISAYTENGTEIDTNQPKILEFLRNQWQQNRESYALTFFWTTQISHNYTLIADCAVAPAFQCQGLMKQLSLALIKELENTYGQAHRLNSFPIHKATYLFFNPDDKACKHFYENDLQEVTCYDLLKRHGQKFKTYTISKEALAFLHQSGLFKTNVPTPAADGALVQRRISPLD